jgi:putative phage-type endonuclease
MEECIIEPPLVIPKTIHHSLARILQRNSRIKQKTKLWFTTRARLISCSDIASVVGENPYSNRKQVFKKKTGQSRPFKGNFATRRGNDLEPMAISVYEKVSGKKVWPEDIGLLLHDDYPQIGGSPDGITSDGILIEIKCPLTREIIPGFIPKQYVAQVQVLMEICDLQVAHFVQFKPGNRYSDEVLDITIVNRDRKYFARVLPLLLDFMSDVNQFYDTLQLPIGTPMINWEDEDKIAKQKLDLDESRGIGTICKFVDCPNNRQKFIMDRYKGVDVPVEHIEMYLDPDETISNDTKKTVNFIKQVKPADMQSLDIKISLIMKKLPVQLQQSIRDDPPPSIENEETSDSDNPFIDIEAITNVIANRKRKRQ